MTKSRKALALRVPPRQPLGSLINLRGAGGISSKANLTN